MSKGYIGKAISNIRLHTGYHVEGVGSVPNVLDSGKGAKWRKDLKMVKTDTGVLCTVTGVNDKPIDFFFPDTNCIGITFANEA